MNSTRCVACLTPVDHPWMRYCRTCRAWLHFADALRIMRATRSDREATK